MRSIKFRGKTKDENWVYGLLIKTNGTDLFRQPINDNPYILHYSPTDSKYCIQTDTKFDGDYDVFPVNEHTVGQFTGLHDKNGKEIYEGDVVFNGSHTRMVVEWCDKHASYILKNVNDYLCMFGDTTRLSVIGNIYDNPDMIEQRGEQ